jgi:hypothetical protein
MQKNQVHIVLNTVTSIVNFKKIRLYFIFYNTTYATRLQKTYSSRANNAMVSLKMVLQAPKLIGGDSWYIYEFNTLCAFSWNKKKLT